jgi:hypothetical protein
MRTVKLTALRGQLFPLVGLELVRLRRSDLQRQLGAVWVVDSVLDQDCPSTSHDRFEATHAHHRNPLNELMPCAPATGVE